MLRNKDKNEEEKRLMDEIRQLDSLIKKEEREQLNLKRILQFEDM